MSQDPPSPSGQALAPGTRLEEFEVDSVLGSGGFGITYLASDTSLNRRVVIKENLPVQFCWRDPASLTVGPRQAGGDDADSFTWSMQNFLREADTLASLDHPGIVKVLRKFEANGTAYFVMPFEEGEVLDVMLKSRKEHGERFSEDEVTGLLEHVLDALGHLHGRGIYHRDIKPGNILITKEGVPVLIDFGSARQRLSERSMTVVESAGYTPFEQLQSRGNVGPWSDLYALGATLAKMLAGAAPPKANDRAFDDPWQPLATRPELKKDYSQGLLESIDRALAPAVSDRVQDAKEWLGALKGEGPVRKNVATIPPATQEEAQVPVLSGVEEAASGPDLVEEQASGRKMSGKGLLKETMVVLSALVLLLIAGGVVIMMSNQKEEEIARVAQLEKEAAERKAREDEAARKKAEEQARVAQMEKGAAERKTEEEDAARKKAEEQARVTQMEKEAAERKAREDEAVRKKAEAELAANMKEEEVRKLRAAGTKSKVTNEHKDKKIVSYLIGADIGSNMKRGELDIDIDRFIEGFKAALGSKLLEYSDEDRTRILEAFSKDRQAMARKPAAKPKVTNEHKDKKIVSYLIGADIGSNMKRGELDIDIDRFIEGFKAALGSKLLEYSDEDKGRILSAFSQERQAMARKKSQFKAHGLETLEQWDELAAKNKASGEKFLAENSKKEGVKTTTSGLQYKVITAGKGEIPKSTDRVKAKYRGTLIDGKVFDQSKGDLPTQFSVRGVIKGWTEALQMMPVGSKWKVFIPSDLAYGDLGRRPPIGPNTTLVFDIELAEITKPPGPSDEDIAALEKAATETVIYFDSASFRINPEERAKLSELAERFTKVPGASLALLGYTDPYGNAAYNRELSGKRCKAVRDTLVELGIEFLLLEIEENGEAGKSKGERSYKSGRRVEFELR